MNLLRTLFGRCVYPVKDDDRSSCKTLKSSKLNYRLTNYRVVNEEESSDGMCDTFEYWHNLPNELKSHIISYMDYRTRFNLSLCSKSDFYTVDKTTMETYSMEIQEQPLTEFDVCGSDLFKCVKLKIYFDFERTDYLILAFAEKIGEEGKCHLMVGREFDIVGNHAETSYTKKTGYYEDEHYQMLALRITAKFLRKCDFTMDRLDIKMTSPILQSMFTKSLKYVDVFVISSKSFEYIIWWLERLGDLDFLLINCVYQRHHDITNLTETLALKSCTRKVIRFYATPEFSEEQFFSLTSNMTTIVIDKYSPIVPQTINTFIKKWKNKEVRKDFNCLQPYFYHEFDEEELIEGIGAKEWDDEFWETWKQFCELFTNDKDGTFYEILNNDKTQAATLFVDGRHILFQVTGAWRNGRIDYSKYRYIPV